jgi:beta-phosphoglucomutase
MRDNSFSDQRLGEIKAIIFDCDGTLVDSENAHYLAWKYALQKQGSDLTVEEYYSHVGYPSETNARLFAQKLGTNSANQIIRDKKSAYFKLLKKGLPPVSATIDFFHRLVKEKEKFSFKLGLASAAGKEEVQLHLKHLGITHLFDIILAGPDDLSEYRDPEGVNKPKPYIFLHAAKILNLHPSQCVVIEDSSLGIAAGSSAGCFTIAVPHRYSYKQDFSRADVIIRSFDGVSVDGFFQMLNSKRPVLQSS